MTRIGVVGLGHWGPNLIRNFVSFPGCEVVCCDSDQERLRRVVSRYPQVEGTMFVDELLGRNDLDAVAIATPTATHFELAKRALERGLHVFVEKPLARSSRECSELIDLAGRKSLVLFAGHVFLYNAAVSKLKELVISGELGKLCYISSSRLSLGPIRQDVNALWDLATHDISIILFLMDEPPVSVNCTGRAFLNGKIHDVNSLVMYFADGTMAVTQVSWIDPNKIRQMTVVGEKKMALYDDVEPLEKIKIFDKGVSAPQDYNTYGEFYFSYRYGDTYIPRLEQVEPLQIECAHFLDCIKTGRRPKTDGENGRQVVRILEAADMSLRDNGARIFLENGELSTEPTGVISGEREGWEQI